MCTGDTLHKAFDKCGGGFKGENHEWKIEDVPCHSLLLNTLFTSMQASLYASSLVKLLLNGFGLLSQAWDTPTTILYRTLFSRACVRRSLNLSASARNPSHSQVYMIMSLGSALSMSSGATPGERYGSDREAL